MTRTDSQNPGRPSLRGAPRSRCPASRLAAALLASLWAISATSAALAQERPVEDYVLEPAEREVFVSPDGLVEVALMLNAQTAPGVPAALSLVVVHPGGSAPEHTHAESAELLYVLDGSGQLTLGGQSHAVSAGQALYLPAGVPHSMTNDGDVPLRALQVYVAPGPEARFRDWTPMAPTPTP